MMSGRDTGVSTPTLVMSGTETPGLAPYWWRSLSPSPDPAAVQGAPCVREVQPDGCVPRPHRRRGAPACPPAGYVTYSHLRGVTSSNLDLMRMKWQHIRRPVLLLHGRLKVKHRVYVIGRPHTPDPIGPPPPPLTIFSPLLYPALPHYTYTLRYVGLQIFL